MHYLVHVELQGDRTLKRCKQLFESLWSAQSYAERLLSDPLISAVRVSAQEGESIVWQRSRILSWHQLTTGDLRAARERIAAWPWLNRQS